MEKFAAGKVRARKYRNRRIREFFKEIELSEKQSTGIPTILKELKNNGSSLPVFETDIDRTYLITTINIRDGFSKKDIISESMSESMSELMSELEIKRINLILSYLNDKNIISSSIAGEILNVETKTANRLLRKAEKIGIIKSQGKTKNKVYML